MARAAQGGGGRSEFRRGPEDGCCGDSSFTSESIRDLNLRLNACTDEIADRFKRYAGLADCQHKYGALEPADNAEDMLRASASLRGAAGGGGAAGAREGEIDRHEEWPRGGGGGLRAGAGAPGLI